MEVTILILCIALALVMLAALICGSVRLRGNRRDLEAEMEKEKNPPARVVVVTQKAGEVRFAYIATPAENPEVSEPEPVEQEEQPESEPVRDGIVIPRAEKLTFKEKYERLEKDDRRYLDEFAAYLAEKPDCEKILQSNALCFRYKKGQVAKAVIRRNTVILNFSIVNPNLGRLVREEKLKSVKMQPAEIRLTSEDALALAKQTADVTVNYLQNEEEYKLEKRRQARRDAAQKKRTESEEPAEEATSAGGSEA